MLYSSKTYASVLSSPSASMRLLLSTGRFTHQTSQDGAAGVDPLWDRAGKILGIRGRVVESGLAFCQPGFVARKEHLDPML